MGDGKIKIGRDQAKISCAGLKLTYFVPEAGST